MKKTEKTGLSLGDIMGVMVTQRTKEEVAAQKWFPAWMGSPKRAKMKNSRRSERWKQLVLASSSQEGLHEVSPTLENQTEEQSL